MAPSKTHGTLPRQDLTRPVGGCPTELRPSDLMQGGHELAETHVGPGMATTSRKVFTRLEAYQLLLKQAKEQGKNVRPPDISLDDRTSVLLKALGLSEDLTNEKELRKEVARFTSKCEAYSRACKRNMACFTRKYKNWLDVDIKEEFNKYLYPQSDPDPKNSSTKPEEDLVVPESTKPEDFMDIDSSHTFISDASDSDTNKEDLLESKTEPYHTRSSGPALSPEPPTPKPRTSKTYEQLSAKQQQRLRKRLQEVLKDEPQSKLIKVFCNTVKVDGNKLSKSAAKDLERVINYCLEDPNKAIEIAAAIKKETHPYTPDEALAFCINANLSVRAYNKIREDCISRGYDAFPPYYKIAEAKKRCCDLGVTEKPTVSTSSEPNEDEDNSDRNDYEMDDSSNSSRWNFYLTNEEKLYHSSSSSSGIASPVSKPPSESGAIQELNEEQL